MKTNIYLILSILLNFCEIQSLVSQNNFNVDGHQLIVLNGKYFEVTNSDTIPLTTDKLLVKFNSGITESDINSFSASNSLTFIKSSKIGISLFEINAGTDFISIVQSVSSDERVQYYDLNYLADLYGSLPIPPTNDSYWVIFDAMAIDSNFMWPYDSTKLYDAWQITTGNSEIVVGMIDNGIYIEHEDISTGPDNYSNLWFNVDEIPENNRDDDNNGYLDDYFGWNFGVINNQLGNNDVSHLQPVDYPHGTTTSGIIAAKTNNEIGVFGIAGGWNGNGVKVMTVKTSKPYFNGQNWIDVVETSQLPFAIEYAVENGARIINMPFGISENINSLEDTFYEYYTTGMIIFLAATGNSDLEDGVAYPASSEYVIAVGATEFKNNESRWSVRYMGANYGSNYGEDVEISAPGSPLKAIVGGTTGQYQSDYLFNTSYWPTYCATSYSVSFASGIVALMLSVDACLSVEEIRDILKNTADKVCAGPPPYQYNYYHDPQRPGHSRELGYGRINAKLAVEACIPYPDQTISGNVTWNTYMRINGNVTVEDGGELTIGSNAIIKFHPYNKIVVKKGGRLIVDGGTITTGCSDFWEGIEVHGDPSLPQVPSSNQGYVQVKNNGKIENALCAIRLFRPDETRSGDDMPLAGNDGGGIAKCLNSQFINNKLALDIRYYPNINNQSTFNNCLFEINDNYLKKYKDEYGNITTPKFDLMTNLVLVNGIDFNACNFKVKDFEHWDPPYYGKAINSINSNFNVKPLCRVMPCEENPDHISTFSGFDYAIYVVNTANLSNFSVEQSEFVKNYTCIYANSVVYPKILKNIFTIRNTEQFPELENRLSSGLYLDECTGYHIEGNKFTGISEDITTQNIGAYIKNSGEATNYVYNNRFEKLTYGSIAEGYNCNDDGTIRGTGLCYKCNDFSQTQIDIFVANPKSNRSVPYGIRAYQGFRSTSDTAAAGNVFSQNEGNWMNIKNEGQHEIQYFHHELAQEPILSQWLVPVRRDYVTPHRNEGTRYTKSNSCKSWIGKTIPPPARLMSDYLESSLIESTSREAIFQLKDGGNTETVLEAIENSYPNEAFLLRDDLLSKSPYLSDTTLKSAIEKEDVLTNSLLRDVLTSNPQAGQSEAILIKLDEKSEPMPDEMYLEILESAENPSPYNQLLEDFAQANHDRSLAFNNLIETFLADTLIVNSQQQLEDLVETDQSVQAELILIKYYLDKGQFQYATSRVQQLQTNLPELTDIGLIQGQLNNYLDIYIPAVTDTLFTLDTTSKQLLEELSIQGEFPIHTWSENLLEILTTDYQPETYVLPTDFENKKIRVSPVASEIPSDQMLYVYPNPANTHFVARYSIPETTKKATLRVTTIDGRMVYEYPLTGFDNEKITRINDLTEAVYIIELIADGDRIASTKLTIVH